MVRRLLLIAVAALALVGLTVPRSVSALECIPLADVVAKMDVIVRGKITAIPSNGVLELSVSRYYKGQSDAAQLRAEVFGIGQGQRMDWNSVPKPGDELIIGFVRRGDALVNKACNLFVQVEPGQELPEDLKSYIGEDVAPVNGGQTEPGQPPHTEKENGAGNTLLWVIGGGLATGLASWLVWRRRRGRRPGM